MNALTSVGIALDTVLVAIQAIFVLCCWVYLICGLDDLAVDVMWAAYKLRDRFGRRGVQVPSREQLLAQGERPLAVMFPAWHEADVIFAAVANIVATIEYSKFEIFIGTYPNDPDTQREADRLAMRFPNVHKVVTSAPGPTCKADCLNHIIAAIRAHEANHGIEFVGVVMQDAEDVVPPLALHVFNWYGRRFDLVQIPVLSLRRRWYDLTGGHYMDEFAEFGAKEMYVRENFAAVVPGCGVGTFYSKRALGLAERTGETFSTQSLTEDYEFSFRMRDAGLRMHFARVVLDGAVPTSGGGTTVRRELVATREYFPNAFRAAFRQKSRWTVGISLQGWRNFRWAGSWRIRYLFWRDRRGLFTAHVTVLGAIAFAAFLGLELYPLIDPAAGRPAPLLAPDSWLWNLVWFNLGLLCHRLIQRHVWAYVHYGIGVLPMVTVRYFWATIVNYCALIRALRLWARHLRTGKPIGWDKTAHVFPIGTATGAPPRRELADLLLECGLLDVAQILQARKRAGIEGRSLDTVLLEVVPERSLADALAASRRLARCDLDPGHVPIELLSMLPIAAARRCRCIPVSRSDSGALVVAAVLPLEAADMAALHDHLGAALEIRIATASFVAGCHAIVAGGRTVPDAGLRERDRSPALAVSAE